jgi:hypothetical protein
LSGIALSRMSPVLTATYTAAVAAMVFQLH